MSEPRVTVAICTWNRSALLRPTLEEMTRLEVPPGLAWELLVVNNNCTDDTDRVIADFETRLPVRRLFEPVPGLSNARNCAVVAARGRWIVWTDDDVLVDPSWLAAYARAFDRWPEAAIFGGPISPWFPAPPPDWLTASWPRIANAYACIDYGAEAFELTERRVPFGANIAFRTDRLRAMPFDPERGVKPGSRMGGEETGVVRALLAAGDTGWWVSDARVRHFIPEERQTLDYVREWFDAYGEYLGRYGTEPPAAMIFGKPRWLVRQAIVTNVRGWWRRRLRPADEWMDDFIAAHTARGALRGWSRRTK